MAWVFVGMVVFVLCMYVHAYMCTDVWMRACIFACMHVHVCMYVYIDERMNPCYLI